MQIQKDTWVQLRYTVSDSEGEVIGTPTDTLSYLHGGYGALFEVIEQALEGQAPGAHVSLYVQPEDAFGDYDAAYVRVEPRALFPEPLEEGMQFEGVPGELEDDDRLYTVTDLTDEVVVLDGNHPLAGMALRFEIEVLAVREASAEEIADEAGKSEGVFSSSAFNVVEPNDIPGDWAQASRTLH